MAEETKSHVQKEEAQAAVQARETQAIADDAQKDLSEALPALVRHLAVDLTVDLIVQPHSTTS